LDNYRIICEKRIRELAPSHPLPVLPSHCGQANPDIEELRHKLTSAKKYPGHEGVATSGGRGDNDFIKMKYRLEQIEEEKKMLEETLRKETLANEE